MREAGAVYNMLAKGEKDDAQEEAWRAYMTNSAKMPQLVHRRQIIAAMNAAAQKGGMGALDTIDFTGDTSSEDEDGSSDEDDEVVAAKAQAPGRTRGGSKRKAAPLAPDDEALQLNDRVQSLMARLKDGGAGGGQVSFTGEQAGIMLNALISSMSYQQKMLREIQQLPTAMADAMGGRTMLGSGGTVDARETTTGRVRKEFYALLICLLRMTAYPSRRMVVAALACAHGCKNAAELLSKLKIAEVVKAVAQGVRHIRSNVRRRATVAINEVVDTVVLGKTKADVMRIKEDMTTMEGFHSPLFHVAALAYVRAMVPAAQKKIYHSVTDVQLTHSDVAFTRVAVINRLLDALLKMNTTAAGGGDADAAAAAAGGGTIVYGPGVVWLESDGGIDAGDDLAADDGDDSDGDAAAVDGGHGTGGSGSTPVAPRLGKSIELNRRNKTAWTSLLPVVEEYSGKRPANTATYKLLDADQAADAGYHLSSELASKASKKARAELKYTNRV
ncbi:MAG: hypothetical protein J3K34DRAFT_436308 [Monoraphidium minutum]|nr:MAG: hypothetical protein J3K34DRAFT_436308 [Monoraphidium minutum]